VGGAYGHVTKCWHVANHMMKFADDTYLIIPALNSHTRDDEVKHVKSWAAANNLQLNCSKSHEIVFRSRRLRGKADQPAPPCPNIERVDTLTVLGVEVNSSLTATDHVSRLLASCSSLLYALRVLRSHGLPDQSLKDVFHATVIGKLMYCAPAWHGFCSASDYVRLDSFLRRCVKLGYAGQLATVTDMFSEADDALFHSVQYNQAHVLHSFLPDRPQTVCSLRARSHNKALICKTSDLNERNFLVRVIYKDCY